MTASGTKRNCLGTHAFPELRADRPYHQPGDAAALDPLRTFRLGIARIRVARVGSPFDAEAQSKINASRTLLRLNRIGHIGCYRILTSDEPEIQPNSAVLQITSAANAEPVAFRHREQ